MFIKIISVNNSTPNWVTESCKSYLKQLSSEISIELIEIKPCNLIENKKKKSKEAEIINKYVSGFFTVALDENGKSYSSRKFSEKLQKTLENFSKIAFVIGGADGLDNEFLKRANLVMSLSALTLPHHLAKVIIIEQIYRAFCILKNHPYHRE